MMSSHHLRNVAQVVLLLTFLVILVVPYSKSFPTGLAVFDSTPQEAIVEDNLIDETTEIIDPSIEEESVSEELQEEPAEEDTFIFYSSSSSSSSTPPPPSPPDIERIAPFVARISPPLGAVDGDGNVTLSCYTVDNEEVATMSLFIDGDRNQTVPVFAKQREYLFNLTGLEEGLYNWSCVSQDINGNTKFSEDWSLYVNSSALPLFNTFYFGGNSTNWKEQPDLRNVCDAVLDRPDFGQIAWLNCVDAVDVNLTEFILIENNNITVNFNQSHSFNSPAVITFRNLSWTQPPQVLRNGEPCNATYCTNIQYVNGELRVTVQGFSSFTTGSNSRLEIWDETDADFTYANQTKYVGEELLFFANYTQLPGGAVISDATCVINFSGQEANMVYNSIREIYEFSRALNTQGNVPFNISCEHGTFEDLATHDTAFMTAVPRSNTAVVAAEVDRGVSERASLATPIAQPAESGNVTGFRINGSSVTQRWQGFFGNVSGSIFLGDASGNALYDWALANPDGEIFASNDSYVLWDQLYCVNFSANTAEEVFDADAMNEFIGYTESADLARQDTVNATFNLTFGDDGSTFSVGSTTFTNADNCSMVTLHTSSGYQTSQFKEVLLTDNNSVVFTTLIENDVNSFNGVGADFEIIVGVNGTSQYSSRNYFFFVELS